MPDDLERSVIDQVAAQTKRSSGEIVLSSRLLHDLGIDGDDAAEFFFKVQRLYGTDLRALIRFWLKHFRPEPTLVDPVRRVTGKHTRVTDLAPITVADVVAAVRAGAWPEVRSD